MRRDQDRNYSPEASKETLSTADLRGQVKQVEADLADQGIKLFPNTKVGQRAYSLWLKIRTQLVRGGAVQITPSALGLNWQRQEMNPPRHELVEMALIRRRADGLYVIGPHDPLDEPVRDRFAELKALEQVMVGLSGLMPKSKTQNRKTDSRASQSKPSARKEART
jgi:hypothetical protein